MVRFTRPGLALSAFLLALAGCGGGGGGFSPPLTLSVSLSNNTVVVPPNGAAVNVPVMIVAPTETASFTIGGLPAGVSESYKESESNPSGLLTLIATSKTMPGTYMPIITVGSSGQTASLVFTLVISAPGKAAGLAPFQANARANHPSTAGGVDAQGIWN